MELICISPHRLGGRTGSWAAQAVADSSIRAAKSADRFFFMLVILLFYV